MLAKAGKPGVKYYFSTEHAVDACDFFEKLPHVEGNWDSDTIILEPWQCFKLCAIFGFRRTRDGGRLVEHAYIEIPRKHGKSLFAAGTSLFCATCEGERRPLIYIAAATQEQADKVLGPAKEITETTPDLRQHFGLKTAKHKIEVGSSRGEIRTISSIGEHQDGHNPHAAVMEELHAQKPDVYEVMRSAFGARRNPLMYQIGTAGRYASGIGYEQRKAAIRVLEGQVDADDVFALIYTIDAEDVERVYDEDVWIKANPNWNVSIFPDKVRKFAREAMDQPSRRGEFLRTRLNVWSNAGYRLIEPDQWEACRNPDLSLVRLRGARAWLGVDLAKYLDMAAVGILVEMDNIIAGFAKFYIPEQSPYLKRADLVGMYSAWIEDGHLTTTPGGTITTAPIRDDIEHLCEFLNVQAVACDPWQAQELAANLEADGMPAVTYRNNVAHMSDPTYEMLARIQSKEFVHDGHAILTWNAMNVEGDERNDTIFPRKPAENADEKIDGFVALIMANGCRLNGAAVEKLQENPYETKSFMREASDASA